MEDKKNISAEEAVKIIKSGNRVFIHGSAATPVCLVNAMQARHQELKNVELISITNLGDVDFDKSNVSYLKGKLYIIEGQTTKKDTITLRVINYPNKAVLEDIIRKK